VLKALAKEPKDWFGTADELGAELRRFLENRPIRSRPIPAYERLWRWCERNPWLAAANITAAVLTTVLAVGSTIAARIYRDQVDALQLEQRRTRVAHRGLVAQLDRTTKAEAKAQFALGQSLLSEGAALQRTGLVGQRFESLDRLARSAKLLRDDPKGHAKLPELRDHAIAAMGLTDLRLRSERQIPLVHGYGPDPMRERYAVIEQRGGETVVRRTSDDRETVRLPRPQESFFHGELNFSPDGVHLLICYYLDGESYLTDVWHLGRRERVCHQPTRTGAHAFLPDGRRFVFAPPGKDLIVWDLVGRNEVKRLPLEFRALSMCVDPEGHRLAANAGAGPLEARILDLETGRVFAAWKDQVGNGAMSWSSDGRLLAIGHWDGRVFVWDVERTRLTSVLYGHTHAIAGCLFAPKGHLLVTGSWDGTSRLWDASTGEALLSAPGRGLERFSSDGHRLTGGRGPDVCEWDVIHGREVRSVNPGLIGNRTEVSANGFVFAAQFSPDNRLAALATGAGVYLYDANFGRKLARLVVGNCHTILFDRMGRSLITHGDRGLFRWPIRTDGTEASPTLCVGPPELLQEPSGSAIFD
jgi:WD40 repeat protein